MGNDVRISTTTAVTVCIAAVAVIVLAAAALFLGKDAVIALGVTCVIVFVAVNWFING